MIDKVKYRILSIRMLSTIFSGATVGLEGVFIKVEVDVADRGFPTFTIVGLPSKAIDESKERVRTAIKNSSYQMPETRLTINLAPADIPKEGSLFDLPIALGILASSGMVERAFLMDSLFVGELSLDGKIRPVSGILPIAQLAKEKKIANLFVPADNAYEAALVEGLAVYPVSDLVHLVLHLNSQKLIAPAPHSVLSDQAENSRCDFDFADIRGQESAKRALEIAASGFHNVHMKGPPGTGKTLLARSFPSILPPMDEEETIEVIKIYSVSTFFKNNTFAVRRPFRSPHHTTSRVGLIGGGAALTPGEISLAHRGILFLDELPEFPRSVLEALRQPLEDGAVTVSRAKGSLTFPSRFLLLAASNPCPCGFLGHAKKPCACSPWQIIKYKKRVSGPLLDRIDIHIDVPPVDEEKLTAKHRSEASIKVRERVEAARVRQRRRFADRRPKTNAEMTSAEVRTLCKLDDEATNLLKTAVSRLSLSARSYFKIIKVSQTIADLAGTDEINSACVAEALQYRTKEE